MLCPKCKWHLVKHDIVKYNDKGGSTIIGKYVYCPNLKCNYQQEDDYL